jgi:hypothetical protein
MTEEQALKRASMWLGVMLKYTGVNPEDISMVVMDPATGKRRVTMADDIEAFAGLGAPMRQEIWEWGQA